MEIRDIRKKFTNLWTQYRYMLFIIAAGVVLMLIPSGKERTEQTESNTVVSEYTQEELSTQLESILSQISGAGKVRVVLSVAAGEETIYQTDRDTDLSTDTTNSEIKTVIISDGQRSQSGLVCQVNPKTYLGAVVVCSGADNPQVKLAIVDAVSKATGLSTNKIAVLKMK